VGAAGPEAQCGAVLALVASTTGDWARAGSYARAARQVLTDHDLVGIPTFVLVTAASALVESVEGDASLARDDLAMTRRSLLHLSMVAPWARVAALVALARAALLLDDRLLAKTLLADAHAALDGQVPSDRIRQQLSDVAAQVHSATHALPRGPAVLTAAELRVLHLLPTNMTLAEIGKRLFVSRNTAKSHATSVYRKLGASSRGEAVELARSAGLLVAEPG
jgi:LuxR family maltose regulon positive regulatory protein